MTKEELSVQYHHEKNNCAQSVLKANSDLTGLDPELAYAVANGFGGGLRSGEICGCISGGIMALGIAASKKGITSIAPTVKSYVDTFREKYGCVRCRELKEKGISCDELIAYCAGLTDRFINGL